MYLQKWGSRKKTEEQIEWNSPEESLVLAVMLNIHQSASNHCDDSTLTAPITGNLHSCHFV